MEVRACKNCRRLFKYIYGPELCPDCTELIKEDKYAQQDKNSGDISLDKGIKTLVKEEEEKFDQVRDYIITHPKASVAEIAEVNGVSPIKLFDWIRDERLEFADNAEFAWFSCQGCGTKIKSGRLCNRCKMAK